MNDAPEKVIIAALFEAGRPEKEINIILEELEGLVNAAGGEVIARCVQLKSSPEPATLLGSGKLAELAGTAEALEADLAVFENQLSPAQLKNIEAAMHCAVTDKTGLILDIFATRARTAEGKLQVALAQYKYLLPRLIGMGKTLSRQTASGGKSPIGTRGPGETKLESDRRHIRAAIGRLEAELEQVRQVRGNQRRARLKNGVPLIALVGYTNAGKSTLQNALTGSDTHTGNRLFDTLDPTTRVLPLPGNRSALLTDTVGFIRELPDQLIEAFRATLEELEYADLVLHVVDASDRQRTAQAAVTERLADELCAPGTPRICVFNKCDLCPPEELIFERPDRVCVSAVTGEGLDKLIEAIDKALNSRLERLEVLLPYGKAALLQLLYREAQVESADYRDDGIFVKCLCVAPLKGKIIKELE